ncbi:hypothetical protein BGX31_000191 [Mortierella sp. GBA43]|nr:hypothetical protein BGX31_000191 [Mortierella sp. GBA43]
MPVETQQSLLNDYEGKQTFVQLLSSQGDGCRSGLMKPNVDRIVILHYVDTAEELAEHLAALRPFTPPSPAHQGIISSKDPKQAVQHFIQQTQQQQGETLMDIIRRSIMDKPDETNAMYMTSVLRKRRLKMKKHKYKKLRKRTRALRKKLGK